MALADLFIVLDDVQFSGPRSFQNRNRFVNSNSEMQWFTVPVQKGSYYKIIKDVLVADDFGWRRKLKAVFSQYKFDADFDEIYAGDKLIDINLRSIELCRKALGITTPLIFSSQLNVSGKKAQKIYNLCKYVGADTYISGMGAYSYMQRALELFSDITIEYCHPKTKDYESTIVHISKQELLAESWRILHNE